MDFFRIATREIEKGPKRGQLQLYPDFIVGRSKDLMIRGRSFYAIWDEEAGLWSTDEYDVQRLVDAALYREARAIEEKTGAYPQVQSMQSFGTMAWKNFRAFMQNISDNSHDLDNQLTWSNTEVKKSDYVSRRLSYPLVEGDTSAWNELIGTLYNSEERAKLEWAIGALVAGDARRIQKFLVLYGPAGTGKSTVLNVVQKLFDGYVTTFEAKALGSNGGAFATEVFKANPLVAIQHDGDLSKIEDNTKLNSIISHEEMTMNEKYKPSYTSRVNAFLFMGTNQPVKISDAKSGIIRRLIDVHPTGVIIPANHYHALMAQIDFELGAIAHYCHQVYLGMGKNFYNAYRPVEMMFQTDVFFNFIEAYFDEFQRWNGTTVKQAYAMYKEYCSETGIDRILPQYKIREELRNYFDEYHDRTVIDGVVTRSVYSGFNANKFKAPVKDEKIFSLVLEEETSLLDEWWADQPAQGATVAETPRQPWERVRTTLADIDTTEVHFVRPPEGHIVIDFDLKGADGRKSLERNLAAASLWPPTYAELSKSGSGVHLHYHYTGGDVGRLRQDFSEGIEVKSFTGKSSLRRLRSRSNSIAISDISSGLPLKEENKVLSTQTIQSERSLREQLAKNLRKETHPGTKPSVDFIKKILDDAYASDLVYDVSDMRGKIMAFANSSSNQAVTALKLVQQMKFKSEGSVTEETFTEMVAGMEEDRFVFFDVEVYPNLFVVCWKFDGGDEVVRLINPGPKEIEALFKFKLIGYNVRRYDNHIMYAAYLGYDNDALYKLSQKLINNEPGAYFAAAYDLSFADIYEFSSKKQSLKKFMIELGVNKVELDIPWDEPVDPKRWPEVVAYCVNDVEGTETTFHSRKGDWNARLILSTLSGLSANDTTQKHTARIIFGNDRAPQSKFVYTDLSKEFEGYEFDRGKSTYRGESPGEGGYVYAKPGVYENVALLDVASMHPTSIINLNLFGEYTPRFRDLMAARLAIKRRDFDSARNMLAGRLARFLQDEEDAEALSYALKIVINIVYGLTSARFENPFKDPRNKDNIVAKRGALFMIDLKNACIERGLEVVHIKTDSIKIANATEEDMAFVSDFGKRYGYDFDHEATYDKLALVNDAVYIAKEFFPNIPSSSDKDGVYKWKAVGAQFAHPYVFKTLFSGEEPMFEDFMETKQVTKGVMFLDTNIDLDQCENGPTEVDTSKMVHIGRIGRFLPVIEGTPGAGVLYRVSEGKKYAVTGTKNRVWIEATVAQASGVNPEIDLDYFQDLAADAMRAIDKYQDFEEFVS